MHNMMKLEMAVARYGGALFRYCAGILCDWHEAQDAVQETFIKAYTRQEAYREEGNLGGWLYRIAYNTCVSMLRKKRFKPTATVREGAYDDPAAARFLSEDLLNALQVLSPQERALVLARAVADMDYRQMAATFNKSEATLRKQYERARRKMQQSMDKINGKTEGATHYATQ